MSHYQKNKGTISSNQSKRAKRNKEYVIEQMTPCVDCGFFHPAAMDFHHTDSSNKKQGVSELSRRGYSLQVLQEEIDKCVCLCSNCHRIRHFSSAG
jgi:hypothetical protein